MSVCESLQEETQGLRVSVATESADAVINLLDEGGGSVCCVHVSCQGGVRVCMMMYKGGAGVSPAIITSTL